jgi:protein-disulfide isomerase
VAAAVLVVAGLVGGWAWQAGQPDGGQPPASVTEDGTGLAVGGGPVTVEVYLDYLCPACRQFHAAARPALDAYLAEGTVTVVYRPIAFLDRLTTTNFSTRAAAAAGCAADRGSVDEFTTGMLANQPPEGGAGLTDAEIVQIGAAAGGGLTGPGFDQCVRGGAYRDWVRGATDAALDRGVTGTPTVFVAGARLDPLSVGALVAAVGAAAR